MITEGKKKLFLLDAFALIYRGYFAFAKNPRINSKGLDTSAIYGFTNSLVEVIKKQKPTHIAVVFDTPKPTQRHVDFPDYKAQREAMPEGISNALPYIDKLLYSPDATFSKIGNKLFGFPFGLSPIRPDG